MCTALRAVLAILLTIAAFQSAVAATTSLVCKNETRPEDPLITVGLDEGRRQVTLNFPAHTVPSSPPGHVAASTQGPFTATFTQKEIAFTSRMPQGGNTGFHKYQIDRVTGVMLDFFSVGAPFEQVGPKQRVMYRWSCQVGKPKF